MHIHTQYITYPILAGHLASLGFAIIHPLTPQLPLHKSMSLTAIQRQGVATDNTNQPPSLRPCTIGSPIETAEQLHVHNDTARIIAKLHQPATWNSQLTDPRATIKLGLYAAEARPAGSDQLWLCCRSLNVCALGLAVQRQR